MRAPILALVLASIPAFAHADEAAAPAPEAAVAAEAAQPDIARYEDPNIDRMMLLPSAETQPAGTLSFNDYELFLLGATYGVTDDFQISALALAPIVEEMPTFVNATAKYRLLGTGRLHLAVMGGVAFGSDGEFDDDFEGDDDDALFALQGGAIASVCLDAQCRSLASASVTAALPLNDNEDNAVGFIYGAGVTAKVAKHAKLLLEVDSMGGHSEQGGFENVDGAVVAYGVRFFAHEIAGDIGFVKPIGEDSDEFVLGFPFINFTYRQ